MNVAFKAACVLCVAFMVQAGLHQSGSEIFGGTNWCTHNFETTTDCGTASDPNYQNVCDGPYQKFINIVEFANDLEVIPGEDNCNELDLNGGLPGTPTCDGDFVEPDGVHVRPCTNSNAGVGWT